MMARNSFGDPGVNHDGENPSPARGHYTGAAMHFNSHFFGEMFTGAIHLRRRTPSGRAVLPVSLSGPVGSDGPFCFTRRGLRRYKGPRRLRDL